MAALESENTRLRNIVQNYKEREKLSYFSHLDSMDQLLNGRQMLYERLEQSISENKDPSDMENIINALNIRTGSFGIERKNLVNSLFKRIIEVIFPNFVKYLFWGSSENKGIFDDNSGFVMSTMHSNRGTTAELS
jgi:RNA processing factor Prp31